MESKALIRPQDLFVAQRKMPSLIYLTNREPMEAGKCVFDTQKYCCRNDYGYFIEPLRLLIQPFLKIKKNPLRRKNKFTRLKPSDGGGEEPASYFSPRSVFVTNEIIRRRRGEKIRV